MKDYQVKGIIIGMEEMGAVFVKMDDKAMFFDIPTDSEMMDKVKQSRAAQCIEGFLGLKLRVKVVKSS